MTHQFTGMGVYDAMKFCKADVSTVCFGLAASMGAFLLAAGTKGKRYCMPNARIMIHQPSGGAGGKVSNNCLLFCCFVLFVSRKMCCVTCFYLVESQSWSIFFLNILLLLPLFYALTLWFLLCFICSLTILLWTKCLCCCCG